MDFAQLGFVRGILPTATRTAAVLVLGVLASLVTFPSASADASTTRAVAAGTEGERAVVAVGTVEDPNAAVATNSANSTFRCIASAGLTGTPQASGLLWNILYTGGWSCDFVSVLDGQTVLYYSEPADGVKVRWGDAPRFDVLGSSAHSSSSSRNAPAGYWRAQFTGNASAPPGGVWTFAEPGCSGVGTTVVHCVATAGGYLGP